MLELAGDWRLSQAFPSSDEIAASLAAQPAIRSLRVDGARLTHWDSALLTFLLGIAVDCGKRGIALDLTALPESVRQLLGLATAVPERAGTRREAKRANLFAAVGNSAVAAFKDLKTLLSFIGEVALAVVQLLRGKARYRQSDFLETVKQCGADALPIVSIISLLVGLIFAFVGAVQLRQFGAQIYVANLVAVAMAREMAAVMTGIVLAGRTGAAFAAQIGAMQGNEEIDALTTLGVSPIEFLVLPRMLALVLMTPLLCVYGIILGMIGGWLVGVGMLNLSSISYLQQTQGAVTLADFGVGIVKAAVFGVLVAVAGCLNGMQSGRTAASVGNAATTAVVSGILYIIITDALFTVTLNVIGL
ncbi:MAG: MlaE family lipid ABC transporter permease subunit [Alphaproteobacteria bacterium]|nr:MlaE family lipid ABC transporter permease subunit [Alphaproteobacteria bacterium]